VREHAILPWALSTLRRLSDTSSDLRRVYLTRLRSASRLSLPPDALLRPYPTRLLSCGIRPWVLRPSERCSSAAARVASRRARAPLALHHVPSVTRLHGLRLTEARLETVREPPTSRDSAPKHAAHRPADVGSALRVRQSAARRDELWTCVARRDLDPERRSAAQSTSMASVSSLRPKTRRVFRRRGVISRARSPKRACALSVTPVQPSLSGRARCAEAPRARPRELRAVLLAVSRRSDRRCRVAAPRRSVEGLRTPKRESPLEATSAVAPGGLQGFEPAAESVPNARRVTNACRPMLSWPCAPPGCALHRLEDACLADARSACETLSGLTAVNTRPTSPTLVGFVARLFARGRPSVRWLSRV
jgi:hypothetical protein